MKNEIALSAAALGTNMVILVEASLQRGNLVREIE